MNLDPADFIQKARKLKPHEEHAPIYLNNDFGDNPEVKALGGFFDPKKRQWYVPSNRDPAPFARWIPQPDPGVPEQEPVAEIMAGYGTW